MYYDSSRSAHLAQSVYVVQIVQEEFRALESYS